eukprot:TRINITY_DN35997_c0_g2_i1.p1 TRINITY_DN35997_c0_g2~~TRINITY_DN35997_c0_g2_i1.p1  ORF type:complete len:580 (+),score=133.62 TRINITY_DN35997_c0_g2_i1:83-1822(+)
MAPTLLFDYNGKKIKAAGSGTDQIRAIKNFDAIAVEAEDKHELPAGTYEFYDMYGKVECLEDLQRAVKMAKEGDCVLEMREHRQFVKIKELEAEDLRLNTRIGQLEEALRVANERQDTRLEECRKQCLNATYNVNRHIQEDLRPIIDGLVTDRAAMRTQLDTMQEKLDQIDLKELFEIMEMTRRSNEEVKNALKRIDRVDEEFQRAKLQLTNDVRRAQNDIKELQRYMQGKLDILIEADADLRRDLKLTDERLALTQDDLRLIREEHATLTTHCDNVVTESEDVREMQLQLREDTDVLKESASRLFTRVNCLEGSAVEKWTGFAPGVVYFKRWHAQAKGVDVRLNANHSVAVGRGFLASSGVVLGSDEGLACADGPARRFGTPGIWSTYFEVEVDEIVPAPPGSGGLYVGVSLQNGEEIANHPKKEFDGWLVGGACKALVCRAGSEHLPPVDEENLPVPSTFTAGCDTGAIEVSMKSVRLLYGAMPRKMKGDVREVSASWDTQELRMGDRLGVLFRCNLDGGAIIRVSVNGVIATTHKFIDAPPAEAIGFLTPVIRLSGNGKAAKICPGVGPTDEILKD